MKMERRSTAVLAVIILSTTAVLIGCNDPVSVDSKGTATVAFSEAISCPPIGVFVEMVVAELDANCPRAYPYRNWGGLNSCEKHIVNQMLTDYNECFSSEQDKEIRRLVLELRAQPINPWREDLPEPHQS